MVIAKGKRVYLRKANLNDTGFMLQLLNQKSFIDNIRDKNIKTHREAQEHIEHAYLIPYQIGLPAPYIVAQASSGQSVGVCGLYQRNFLRYPDVGYAFLDHFTGKGYAAEAVMALIEYVKLHESYQCLSAITLESNTASINVLKRTGFTSCGAIIIDQDHKPVVVFERNL
ncbi:GNAT family N-acetyltransferase [Pseudoalteromonas peptidolytica]|uniref:N-acetyltransferase domain-containing protein n=1 Tax=Pseudoalteromonas peptidolytica F12-50-A1 TaxID=1315280 RepID=A0A8I0N156_9GAMM|nr:GNAT family N-acetyltransferase [Pseudoalteromonas peptidolytica]MBE0348644.1 hypothetical protein [Pseudoalteromonas peptidolytica F12-50-A1]NLR15737.1 GNAT family N-acetyltransferase [Pseudoalteromonas peptidolytica]GEK11512.1 N-acetyltransferase GCN5 [Pseudoalteromonas peptidolytica]